MVNLGGGILAAVVDDYHLVGQPGVEHGVSDAAKQWWQGLFLVICRQH